MSSPKVFRTIGISFSLRPTGILRVAHAPAQLELDGLGVGDIDVALEVLDDFFSGVIALAVGLVNRDSCCRSCR